MSIVPQEPRDLALYHMLKSKHDRRFLLPAWRKLPRRIEITRAGFRDLDAGPARAAAFRFGYAARRLASASRRWRARFNSRRG